MKRVRRLFIKLIVFLPAIFSVLLIRVLRPFVVIRLLGIDLGRIGGVIPLDWYLAECQAGMHGSPYYDVFYLDSSTGGVSNRQWFKMWKRECRIISFTIFSKLVFVKLLSPFFVI